jgi:hypothetical protein
VRARSHNAALIALSTGRVVCLSEVVRSETHGIQYSFEVYMQAEWVLHVVQSHNQQLRCVHRLQDFSVIVFSILCFIRVPLVASGRLLLCKAPRPISTAYPSASGNEIFFVIRTCLDVITCSWTAVQRQSTTNNDVALKYNNPLIESIFTCYWHSPLDQPLCLKEIAYL